MSDAYTGAASAFWVLKKIGLLELSQNTPSKTNCLAKVSPLLNDLCLQKNVENCNIVIYFIKIIFILKKTYVIT